MGGPSTFDKRMSLTPQTAHPDANIQTVKMGAMMGGSACATPHAVYDELTSA